MNDCVWFFSYSSPSSPSFRSPCQQFGSLPRSLILCCCSLFSRNCFCPNPMYELNPKPPSVDDEGSMYNQDQTHLDVEQPIPKYSDRGSSLSIWWAPLLSRTNCQPRRLVCTRSRCEVLEDPLTYFSLTSSHVWRRMIASSSQSEVASYAQVICSQPDRIVQLWNKIVSVCIQGTWEIPFPDLKSVHLQSAFHWDFKMIPNFLVESDLRSPLVNLLLVCYS